MNHRTCKSTYDIVQFSPIILTSCGFPSVNTTEIFAVKSSVFKILSLDHILRSHSDGCSSDDLEINVQN
ncbi:hypothetical protein Y032_0029g1981 [Ancylostoma ceylanicum]|nr:hypothetical protein Y032_0029g1981 [Ancylostoma ceylanicum]